MADRSCLDCGARVRPDRKLSYCPECGKSRCHICGECLPAGRRARYCTPCQRARQAKCYAKPGRHCSCGRPLSGGYPHSECQPCASARQALRNALLVARRDAACITCRKPIQGRASRRCRECDRKRSKARERGLCPKCRKSPTWKQQGTCRLCGLLYNNWRRAYRAGDPVARSLGKVRKYRHWQKKEPPP